jgi:hypothetical protein
MMRLDVPPESYEFVHASEGPVGLLAWTPEAEVAPRPINVCRTGFGHPWCTCLTYALAWRVLWRPPT